ncbi:hypothetical protein RDWZM_007111 [Blomia tropicalis]|uniref:Uncharacterized protein n=1 Tax=Blomia tropicalis TaxID=40697 RepID=A0A9Q0M9H5_BLOTA|nr:hypothetical protein RDWZM_007111 [Blomia tropicalis]
MFPTKMFAFVAVLLVVLVQLASIQLVQGDDKIIFGGGDGCGPSFLLKDDKKDHTIVMNHGCHKKKHHYGHGK